MRERARIHFAANDDRGNFTGRASAIEMELPGDELVTVAVDSMPVARFKWNGSGGTIRIGGRNGIRASVADWNSWVGNMAWEAAIILPEDALAILRWLLAHGGQVESYTCGGKIEEIVNAAIASVREPAKGPK